MDYKEKYDEALKVAQETYETQPMYREWLEKMFPELAETKNERIRKELIENLRELSKLYDTLQTAKEYSKVQSWIAWLEKQGKKAKYHDICDKCVRQPTCQSDCFLQQSEQKPTDKVEPKFKIGDRVRIKGRTAKGDVIRNIYQAEDGNTYFEFENSDDAPADCDLELVEEPKKCMYTKDDFTEEDRKILCEDCEEECEYAKKEEPVSENLEDAASSFARKDSKEINNPANFFYVVAEKARIFKAGAQWMHKKMIHEFNLKEE